MPFSVIDLKIHADPLMRIANLPDESITPISSVAKTGIYFGYAQVLPDKEGWPAEDKMVYPMVMSLGLNPFYKNERLTAV